MPQPLKTFLEYYAVLHPNGHIKIRLVSGDPSIITRERETGKWQRVFGPFSAASSTYAHARALREFKRYPSLTVKSR